MRSQPGDRRGRSSLHYSVARELGNSRAQSTLPQLGKENFALDSVTLRCLRRQHIHTYVAKYKLSDCSGNPRVSLKNAATTNDSWLPSSEKFQFFILTCPCNDSFGKKYFDRETASDLFKYEKYLVP